VAINDRERAGEKRTSYGNLIADVEFTFDVLRYAREFEIVIKTNKLKINAKKLVSIQYAK
jgi:hypothetical protein